MRLIATAVALLLIASQAKAQEDPQTVLKQFGEFMVGTWTPTQQADEDGPRKHIYSWMLHNKFLHSDGQQDPNPWEGFVGIEPKSKKLAWWGFFADGTAGPIYLIESSSDQWVFEGDGARPDGKGTRRVSVFKTGDSTVRGKVEDIVDGETTVVEETDWVRRR